MYSSSHSSMTSETAFSSPPFSLGTRQQQSSFVHNYKRPIRRESGNAPFAFHDLSRKATRQLNVSMSDGEKVVTVLDYGAGNVRSLENAVASLGYSVHWVKSPEDIYKAEKLLFPGVGAFGLGMENLKKKGFVGPLRDYIKANKPYLGICIGLQTLFEGSEESLGVEGLGIFPGLVKRFNFTNIPGAQHLSIPHMGWNTIDPKRGSVLLDHGLQNERFYFVHSFRADMPKNDPNLVLASAHYGTEFVAALQKGNICATQFHPEKSGAAGIQLIKNFLEAENLELPTEKPIVNVAVKGLSKRIVACLDVRENDDGDLVVTKGDQYDVREKSSDRKVRNLGKPVSLAQQYFRDGADEVTFLNITSFRSEPLSDTPMLEVLEQTSTGVFVPLCIGGGIRGYTDQNGVTYSALDVAARYFRAGADKVSLGSDAVFAAEKYYANKMQKDGSSSIEQISELYGAQAVVISVDPKRVYVESPSATTHATIELKGETGPNGEKYCWYQCTVKGGREGRDLDVVQLVKATEALGAGEILLNSMDADGQKKGYDLQLIEMVRNAVSIPVIASSGAGEPAHFTTCFQKTGVEAALAAGIFHRNEVKIQEVKDHLKENKLPVRTMSDHHL